MSSCKSINFCYLCSTYIKTDKRLINKVIKDLIYKVYNVKKLEFIDCNWSPKFICSKCRSDLYRFKKVFSSLPIYNKPKSDHSDCFFCNTTLHQYNIHFNKGIIYPKESSAFLPKLVDDKLVNTSATKNSTDKQQLDESNNELDNVLEILSDLSTPTKSTDLSFQLITPQKLNHLKINQKVLNDIVRLLLLSKEKSEQLAAILKALQLLEDGVNVTFYRTREDEILAFFDDDGNGTAYLSNIHLFFKWLNFNYNPNDWRLFIDSNSTDKQQSLKVFLLFNKNTEVQDDLPPVLLLYSNTLKENYQDLSKVLSLIKYNLHKWQFCGDLKVMNCIAGIGGGSHKHPCLFCNWCKENSYSNFKGNFIINNY